MHLTPRGARLFLCAHALVEDLPHTDPADLTDFFVGEKSHRGWWWGGSHRFHRSRWFLCGWGISQRLVMRMIIWVFRFTEFSEFSEFSECSIHSVYQGKIVIREIRGFQLATNLHKFSRIIFRCDFSYICGWNKKIGCTGWCTLWFWSDRRDSNPRPSAWEANALPTEPLSHNVDIFIAPYGGLLLLNSPRRLLLRECRLLSRCRLLPMRQCCRGWVRDKRSRGILFDRLQRKCCS